MTTSLPEYENYALRYATMARKRQEALVAFDPHDEPMPIDYFVYRQWRNAVIEQGLSTIPANSLATHAGWHARHPQAGEQIRMAASLAASGPACQGLDFLVRWSFSTVALSMR